MGVGGDQERDDDSTSGTEERDLRDVHGTEPCLVADLVSPEDLPGLLRQAERAANIWRSRLVDAEAGAAREKRRHDRRVAELKNRLRASEQQIENLDELVGAMQHTVSWRVTRPLRVVRSLSRRQPSGVAEERKSGADDGGEEAVSGRHRSLDRQPDIQIERLRQRLDSASSFLGDVSAPGTTVVDALQRFDQALAEAAFPDGVAAWLAFVVATGSYPDRGQLELGRRRLRRAAAWDLADEVSKWFVTAVGQLGILPELEFLCDAVLVDITHTAMYDLHTGIQRVTRECASRWLQHDDALLVHYDEEARALKRLSDEERGRTLQWRDNMNVAGEEIRRRRPREATGATIVPWRCVHLIPELVDSIERTARYTTMQASGVLAGQSMIVYDLIPVTAAEYTARGVAEAFAHYLALVKRASAVSAISNATAQEVLSFFGALHAQGLTPPRLKATPLPAGTVEVDADTIEATRQLFRLGSTPLVVVVGSHEPRKNHVVVLEAAEHLWTAGHRFELLFVGGASWGRADFADEVRRLVSLGFPLQVHERIDEQSLWALYRLAAFTVFVSFLEGYGLPVAESLSCGTPVITTKYGSMAEIATGGGALTVDPRDPVDVERAMAALLSDPHHRAVLAAEATARAWITWPEYADALWHDLVHSVRSDASASAGSRVVP